MEVFVNEMSLHKQFDSNEAFASALKEVLLVQKICQTANHRLYCLRNIHKRRVLQDGTSFRQALQTYGNKQLLSQVMGWISKYGPFVDDERLHTADDRFEYRNKRVTNRSLGEAAARQMIDMEVATFSFKASKFCHTPLKLLFCLSDDDKTPIDLQNFWERGILEQYFQNLLPEPATWTQMIEQLKIRFPNLDFASNLLSHLEGEPFNITIANTVRERLAVLSRLKECFDEKGQRTEEGNALVKKHFGGGKPHFTDASETEKNDPAFSKRMMFRLENGEKVPCYWHGKINHRYFRIHFSYPIKKDEPLYIAYIGQKRTKQ
ncbi:MAG: hypothetical protein H0T73_09855 [Ardenticatenales bacterium]|nr:hypothetical protein [Ardenticatenales bacterium]